MNDTDVNTPLFDLFSPPAEDDSIKEGLRNNSLDSDTDCETSKRVYCRETTQPAPSKDFVAIDVETANSEQDICQFGLAVVHDLEIKEQRSWYIQPPGNRYEQRQMSVHHITPDMTANAPTLAQVWPEIYDYLRDMELWAHNATCAERSILARNLFYYAIICELPTIYDSIRLFSRPRQRTWNDGLGLDACAYALGVPYKNHHDAGADAAMCAQVIIAHAHGVVPDWELSDRMMAEHKKQAEVIIKKEIFIKEQDGTDSVDFSRLNIAETNPLYGATVVLTGFFHIGRKSLREALTKMGAHIASSVTKKVQVVLEGERNAGVSKLDKLHTLIYNGYNISHIKGDVELDRILYDTSLTPADFSVPEAAKKDLNFNVSHYRKNHHALIFPANSIYGRELFLPSIGLMGRHDLLSQMLGNLGVYANSDYSININLIVFPETTVNILQHGEKDGVVRAFEEYYNSQRSVTFKAEFIGERDILKYIRERIVRCQDMPLKLLYCEYLQSAGIDPEKDFKYGLAVVRKEYEKEIEAQYKPFIENC